MERLRETISPEDKEGVSRTQSRYKTAHHPYGLHCRECGELYYVDQPTYEKVVKSLEFDPSDNPFVCERCEDEYGYELHNHG